jgi:cytochrome bd-type quinol oxidase subunit 2
MIRYSITVASTAAPPQSLASLFCSAGLFVLPIVALYRIRVYGAFREKVTTGYSQ